MFCPKVTASNQYYIYLFTCLGCHGNQTVTSVTNTLILPQFGKSCWGIQHVAHSWFLAKEILRY
jgi:hypothetical protein